MPNEPNVIFYPDPDVQRKPRYVEVKGQPPDPKLPLPRAHTPLDSFGMDSPWDDQTALYAHRKFLPLNPVPPPPIKEARTPYDAFGYDMPWDDWTALYGHRRYVETNIQPPDPKLPLPRAHTPLDAFGMDSPWDDWVTLYRRNVRTLGFFGPDRFPPHRTRPNVELIEWDPWEPIYAQPHRRSPGLSIPFVAPFIPKRRRPEEELIQWDEIDVVQFRHRRFLLVPVVPFVDHGPSMIAAVQAPMAATGRPGMIAAVDQPMTATGRAAMIAAVDEPMIARPRP